MASEETSLSVFTMYTHKCTLVVNTRESMANTSSDSGETRDESINLRISRNQKHLIDRAAQALGRNRSDFMLDAACREAEDVLLDRRYFALPEEAFKRFMAMLDKPPASNPRLTRLLKAKAPWEK